MGGGVFQSGAAKLGRLGADMVRPGCVLQASVLTWTFQCSSSFQLGFRV